MSGEHAAAYLDASAVVKLVTAERESAALRAYLDSFRVLCSCALVRVEAVRAVAPQGELATARARQVVAGLRLVALEDHILTVAAGLPPPVLRTLDAIHVAAALSLGSDLRALVTYDRRMQDAARALGLPVEAPA